jgi:hypothetical protein
MGTKMFITIYIQICIAKTRNGKLVAFVWKQPLQEKLDIDSEESDLHALNIICDTDNDDFCVEGYQFSISCFSNANLLYINFSEHCLLKQVCFEVNIL